MTWVWYWEHFTENISTNWWKVKLNKCKLKIRLSESKIIVCWDVVVLEFWCFCFGSYQESNLFFVWGFGCLSGGMSLSGSDEAPLGSEVLSKKKRSRAAYKGYLSKLEKDITTF